ncbi:hypothetical protein QAD02_023709 [Eretmocerus hayati]|uniref:Uncharacterized protein n=1 Tax=Eretmocerus hayati TaxID=131215 RepID=A0ACC2PXA5_9HYME|nr:hypothetical protein QAD02_023709 [Eretmocerus hayati]
MTTELQPSQPNYCSTVAGPDKCISSGLQCESRSQHIDCSTSKHTNVPVENELGYLKGPYSTQACCRKNSIGYKNDSGYSESLGFESFSLALSERDTGSPPPAPPVRDASSLKSLRYGPGHEKYPSWPSSAPECQHSRVPSSENGNGNDDASDELIGSQGGSHRSKSWTDSTNYPKEKPAQYSRPHSKRSNASFTQQLKTVLEKCEKIPLETFESRPRNDIDLHQQQLQQIRMWPSVDREGKSLGDADYVVPSPPERESMQTTTLNPADLEAYVRNYQDPQVSQVGLYSVGDLAQTGLMDEYTTVQHSQQASYAQSEGYHSYVSSVDSTTTTPFLDRLRRDSEAVTSSSRPQWDEVSITGGGHREGRDSVVTTSSGSASSSETLKWHGSMSDVSVSSCSQQQRWQHSGSMSDVSSSILSRHNHNHQIDSSTDQQQQQLSAISRQQQQLIVHSARVQTPQRHHSESVLYLDDRRQQLRQSQRKLYPVSTTKLDEPPPPPPPPPLPPTSPSSGSAEQDADRLSTTSSQQPQQQQPSVAERISELERQQQQLSQQMRYTYLDPDKRHRQQQRHSPPPQPPPRPRPTSSRRASCASDYAPNKTLSRSQVQQSYQQADSTQLPTPRHQHSNSCGSLSTDLLGPVIVGPAISIDDWVPERPPKKPYLRNAFSERLPSPDLPPPSPPTVTDVEVLNFDDPLPPPPPELSPLVSSPTSTDSKNLSSSVITDSSFSGRIKGRSSSSRRSSRRKNTSSAQQSSDTPPKCKSVSPSREILQQTRGHLTPLQTEHRASASLVSSGLQNGFGSSSRLAARGRSSLRFTSSTKKREKLGIEDEPRLAPYGLTSSTSGTKAISNAQQLTDLLAQRYTDSGNQRAAPQVPVMASVSGSRQVIILRF